MFKSYHHLSALIILTWNKQVINQLFYSVISIILPVNLMPLWVVYSRKREDHRAFCIQVDTETNIVLKLYWNVALFQDEHYTHEGFLGFSSYNPYTCHTLGSPLMSFILSPTVVCNTLGRKKTHGDLYIICFVF